MARFLLEHGPLSVALNAGLLQQYTSGIVDPWKRDCDPNRLDHAVTIVGFGKEGTKQYWTVRNSWGEAWGESGHFRIRRGHGTCGINQDVNTPVVSPKSSRFQDTFPVAKDTSAIFV